MFNPSNYIYVSFGSETKEADVGACVCLSLCLIITCVDSHGALSLQRVTGAGCEDECLPSKHKNWRLDLRNSVKDEGIWQPTGKSGCRKGDDKVPRAS